MHCPLPGPVNSHMGVRFPQLNKGMPDGFNLRSLWRVFSPRSVSKPRRSPTNRDNLRAGRIAAYDAVEMEGRANAIRPSARSTAARGKPY